MSTSFVINIYDRFLASLPRSVGVVLAVDSRDVAVVRIFVE